MLGISRCFGSTLYLINNFNHFTMPYIIAVLALVIIGTGYTLFQRVPPPTTESTLDYTMTSTDNSASTSEAVPLALGTEDNKLDTAIVAQAAKPIESSPSPSVSPKQAAPAAEPVTTPAAPQSIYTEGTYNASKSYRTPDGTYQMNLSVTIKNDKISATSLSFDTDGARDGYSKKFLSGYQSQVIGKDLGNISVSRVGGASLTTRAFNDALLNIRSQAS